MLGAGLCGLSCAYHLGEASRYRLLEREGQVGGMARTRRRPGGFLCDGTGHWLHLAHDETRQLVAGLLPLEPRSRRSRVYSHGVFTRYPFQANLYGLPPEVIDECLQGFAAREGPPPANYREWLERTFGAGICRHFMVPYNCKLYGVPLESLAAGFGARYIPQPVLETVLQGATGAGDEALGYNARFLYPVSGGIGALSEALHAACARPAELGRQARSLDLVDRVAVLDDGEEVGFERLVSTIPLPSLVALCAGVPAFVADAARRLRASAIVYYDVGVKGEAEDFHWVYFPEPSLPFYRVGSYSAVEPSLAPPGHRSYYVELGSPADDSAVLDGLRAVGLLRPQDEVVFMVSETISPAYVLYDHEYEQARKTVLDWLDSCGVRSVGRYGSWNYSSMEDALLEGKRAAR